MKPENQSDKLTEFYRAWLAWAEGGENVHGFRPYFGLCGGAFIYGGENLHEELSIQLRFETELGEASHPFDETLGIYFACRDKRTNPKRLQWCRDHI